MYRNRSKSKSRVKTFVMRSIIAIIILFLVLAGIAWSWYSNNVQPAGDGSQQYSLVISPGETDQQVAIELKNAGIIKSIDAYRVFARINGYQGSMVAGEYSLNNGLSVNDILQKITGGEVETSLVTILPGSRLSQIRESLVEQGFSEAEVDSALDPSLYADHPALSELPEGANLEGYLFPESFRVTNETPVEAVIRLSLDEMALLLNAERRAGIASQGLTTHEGVILASIVEEEVSNLDDKPKVAQVFLKRLNENISLGSDPTARYGASLYGLEETVFADTEYNTRTNAGLTPSPISNVSPSSLDAVINPSNTEYLYFVSGDDGITRFSFTLEEHERKTAEFCKELCLL